MSNISALHTQTIANAAAVYPAQNPPPGGFSIIISANHAQNKFPQYAAFLVRVNVELAFGVHPILDKGLWKDDVEAALMELMLVLTERVREKLVEAQVPEEMWWVE